MNIKRFAWIGCCEFISSTWIRSFDAFVLPNFNFIANKETYTYFLTINYCFHFVVTSSKSSTISLQSITNQIHFLYLILFTIVAANYLVEKSVKQSEHVLQYGGFFYKKAIGRAYHSYWICVKSPCNGKIKISELKGGSITLIKSHDVCNKPKWKYHYVHSQITPR